ncbi:MAG: efflux RND transporter periplasmic adaptor subunit [Gammaproteobacteria bacterium]
MTMMLLLFVSPTAYAAETDAGPVALVQTAAVEMREIDQTLQSFGTIEPGPRHLREIVAPRASIVELEVATGMRVKRGEPLATLVATPESTVLYAQAKAEADYARSALQRMESLFKEKLATRDQLAVAEKALANAQANLAAQQQMGGGHAAVIRAPAAGVVTTISVASGARVTANTTLLTLAEQGGLYARLGVTPEQSAAIHTGIPVALTSAFGSQLSLSTKVSQVGGQVDPMSGLVDVFAPVLGKSADTFLPGSQVTAEITLQEVHSLAVPRSAVLQGAEGAYVFIVKHHIARRVNVKAGVDDGTWIAVIGALEAGDQVVTLGNYELTNGMVVRGQAP